MKEPYQKLKRLNESRSRVSVEWNYSRVLALFAGLKMAKSFKLRLSPISLYYRIAVILWNVHCCLNGNQIGIFFDCNCMPLDEYLHCCADEGCDM